MDAGYELFDHTADVGVRVFAPTLPELLRAAGEGLYGVIGELRAQGEPHSERFELQGGDLPELLRDYLSELLLIFERDHRLLTGLQVDVCEPGRLQARGETRAIDRGRSCFDREVKAVTYHGLELSRLERGFEFRYIVDV